MRRVARRAAKLPVRGSVRGSVCVGNSSGPPSVPICAAAPPPPEARSTCCGYTVVVGTAGPGSSRPALGRPWRKIRSRPPPAGADSPSPADSGWLPSPCLRACDSAAVRLPPNHGVSHKLNQHPHPEFSDVESCFPVCHQRGFFFLRSDFL